MDELYLENLDEYIEDEKRIVTYKWLSLELQVSSNYAKLMLANYLHKKQLNSEAFKFSATYLISGILYDTSLQQDVYKVLLPLSVCIVRDSELNDVKPKFKSIFSIHIYSIQKAQLHDLNLLYAADYDKVKENVFNVSRYSGIIFPSAQLRTTETKAQSAIQPLQKSLTTNEVKCTKVELEATEVKTLGKEAAGVTSEITKKKVYEKKKSGAHPQRGSIASLFANQVKIVAVQKKINEVIESPVEIPGKKSESSNSAPKISRNLKGGPLASFLKRGSPRRACDKLESNSLDTLTETSVKMKIEPTNSLDALSEENEEDFEEKVAPKSRLKSAAARLEEVKNNKAGWPKNRNTYSRKRPSHKTAVPESTVSKRRRVVQMDSSSESSDDDDNDTGMDESPFPSAPALTRVSSDDEEVIPQTHNTGEVTKMNGRRRKRKLIDKTFVDEERFLVTKKEYELVTDSDDEESPLVINKVAIPPKNLRNSPVKTKQTTITCFYKKR